MWSDLNIFEILNDKNIVNGKNFKLIGLNCKQNIK